MSSSRRVASALQERLLRRAQLWSGLLQKPTVTVSSSGRIPLGSVVSMMNESQKRTYAQKQDNHQVTEQQQQHGEQPHGEKPRIPNIYDMMKDFDPIPYVPKRETYLAKICGAFCIAYLLYMFREQGALIFGLEPLHFEHGAGDTDSEQDDEDWSADEEEDDLELDIKIHAMLQHEEKTGNKMYKKIQTI